MKTSAPGNTGLRKCSSTVYRTERSLCEALYWSRALQHIKYVQPQTFSFLTRLVTCWHMLCCYSRINHHVTYWEVRSLHSFRKHEIRVAPPASQVGYSGFLLMTPCMDRHSNPGVAGSHSAPPLLQTYTFYYYYYF